MNYNTVTFALVNFEYTILAFEDFPDSEHAEVWADNHPSRGRSVLLELDLVPGERPSVGARVGLVTGTVDGVSACLV